MCESMGEPRRRDAEQNKPVTKGPILHDFTPLRSLESSDSKRQKVAQWEPGAAVGRNERVSLNGQSFKRWMRQWPHSRVKVLNTTKLSA